VPADTQADPADPPGTIDGAKNPEMIPDDVALRMIVLAVAEPTNASEEQKQRARAKIASIGLSDEDAAAFLALLAQFQDEVDAVDKRVAEIYQATPFPDPASTVYKELVDLGNQKDQLATDAVAAIPAKLSQNGLTKLGAFLPQAKRGMKIIADTNSKTMSMN
jgi:tRNA-binding EMAP/Myf-like protein